MLTPPAPEQNASQRKIEHPAESWEDLKTHVLNKDLSYSISTSMTGIESGSSYSRISRLKEQVRLLTEQWKGKKLTPPTTQITLETNRNPLGSANVAKKPVTPSSFVSETERRSTCRKREVKTDQFRDEYRKRSYSREKNDRERPTTVHEIEEIRMIEQTIATEILKRQNSTYNRKDSDRRKRSHSNNGKNRRKQSFDRITARHRSPTPNVRFD